MLEIVSLGASSARQINFTRVSWKAVSPQARIWKRLPVVAELLMLTEDRQGALQRGPGQPHISISKLPR